MYTVLQFLLSQIFLGHDARSGIVQDYGSLHVTFLSWTLSVIGSMKMKIDHCMPNYIDGREHL